ncbi:MAG: hypothetical protein RIR16_769 [Actinomycetota bacterium]
MIRIGSLFPGHLNLNGDMANADILSYYLKLAGLEHEIAKIESLVDTDFDFVVIGHGSSAAWRNLPPARDIAKFITQLNQQGATCLLIGSAVTKLSEPLGFSKVEKLSDRESVFVAENHEQHELIGYRNTEYAIPNFYESGNIWLSALHGPLLAKNPWLVEKFFIKHGLEFRSLPVQIQRTTEAARQLAREQSGS